MNNITAWKEQITRLDAAIRPIATRPIDVANLNDWMKKSADFDPLAEAGVKQEAEGFLSEIMQGYSLGDAETRADIRKLFAENQSFSWAAKLPYEPTSESAFRDHLILFSIKDLARDTRDAILWLQNLCEKATSAGVKTGPILAEIAQLSSDVNKHGMSSTRSLLLGAITDAGS